MRFDASALRYLTPEDFRVLTAVEMGMKNHNIVPSDLIRSIAALRHGGVHRVLKNLLRHKLIARDRRKYDGYKLTYSGYDYLALKAMVNRNMITAVGNQIGVGKESDIFVAIGNRTSVAGSVAATTGDPAVTQLALKLHRLGRISFRAIKRTRDYFHSRSSASWLYLSRLAALKEYAFMKALSMAGFPVPRPVSHNRHCVLMALVEGCQLNQIKALQDTEKVYNDIMSLPVRLGRAGLVHCDFNEFNILVGDDETVTLIDFPQMVSSSHPNARFYFSRDVECMRCFFRKRFGFEKKIFPTFDDIGLKKADGALDGRTLSLGLPADHREDIGAGRYRMAGSPNEKPSDGRVKAVQMQGLRIKPSAARKKIAMELHGTKKSNKCSGRNRNKDRGGH